MYTDNMKDNNSQPDTYETPDPIATPQDGILREETENENIDRDVVVIKSVFSKFADSRELSRATKRAGFLSHQKDFEILADQPHSETPLQKFHRLQFEVKQFLQDLEATQKAQPNTSIEQGTSPLDLTHQLAFLQQQLQGLVADERARAMIYPQHFIQHYSHLQADLSKKLVAELSSVKPPGLATPLPVDGPAGKAVTYELYYTPDQVKHMQASKLVDIERRLTGLETLIGQPNSGMPLISTVAELRDKVVLLDPSRLEGVQQRMKAILPQLEAVGRAHPDPKGNSTSATEKKINELYETINKWDLVAQQLPALVGRLTALHALHEDGLRFSTILNKLENEQQAMSSLLGENSVLLSKVRDNFSENVETIQRNMGLIEERFKTLEKQLNVK